MSVRSAILIVKSQLKRYCLLISVCIFFKLLLISDNTAISSLCLLTEELVAADDEEDEETDEELESDVDSGARARHSSMVGRVVKGSSWLIMAETFPVVIYMHRSLGL
ncbi:hypothetical protein DPMN_009244 [Dreissena polymorpha]|uniref:Uncharacterized protein n=1 Tax=Dreissena polymorpha TaxID=45954 RepID=A0A9D4N058_DREPO|nr:hypothetical protein DPMN_009244 [Dreissena polymorpha]